MFTEVIDFLAELKQNNHKNWFDQNRVSYKSLNEEFKYFVGEIIEGLGEFDPALKFLQPNECTYRINRDTRFSQDKSPYKTWLAAAFSPQTKNGDQPGYYFQVDSNGVIRIGGGWYQIDKDHLLVIRQNLAEEAKELRKILNEAKFVNTFQQLEGEQLKTAPKGFPKDSPNIDLLKYKNFVVSKNLAVSNMAEQSVKMSILETFRTMSPLVLYLRKF